MTVYVETYTKANGSNMDCITFENESDNIQTIIEEIARFLRFRYSNWDYGYLWDENENDLGMIVR